MTRGRCCRSAFCSRTRTVAGKSASCRTSRRSSPRTGTVRRCMLGSNGATTPTVNKYVSLPTLRSLPKGSRFGYFFQMDSRWFLPGLRVKAPSHQASASTDGNVPQHFRHHAMPMLSVHKPITFTHGRHWRHYAGPTLR